MLNNKDEIILFQYTQIENLLAEIKVLRARIIELENNQRKNSNNSSKPPSSDFGKVKKTQSLRVPSGKKVGGQLGHQGENLKPSPNPDEFIVHRVLVCKCCGEDLSGVVSGDYKSRQVFDLPPIKLKVTAHQAEIKCCPNCLSHNTADFPNTVSQAVQYGPEIQKLAIYFLNYQLLPYGRTADLFEDLLNHRINQSSLVSMNKRCSRNLTDFITQLQEKLIEQPVLHADETGYRYNAKRNWLHVLTSSEYTLYMPHTKRGKQAMDDMGILPNYKGFLVHDFWKAYNEYSCKHSLCNVHHLRDLTFCAEIEKSTWAAKMKQYLLELNELVGKSKTENAIQLSPSQIKVCSDKYNELIDEGWKTHPPPIKEPGKRGQTKKSKTQNMLQRFKEHKNAVLAFIYDFNVPFGNNLAEQAIRMMKVKQKVSGTFRSEQGAIDFAKIRSYIATNKKQGKNIMQALELAVIAKPWSIA